MHDLRPFQAKTRQALTESQKTDCKVESWISRCRLGFKSLSDSRSSFLVRNLKSEKSDAKPKGKAAAAKAKPKAEPEPSGEEPDKKKRKTSKKKK